MKTKRFEKFGQDWSTCNDVNDTFDQRVSEKVVTRSVGSRRLTVLAKS